MDTDEIITVTRAGPHDVIAAVWYTLGYKPRDSLVLVGMEGPRNRIGLMLRVDLPPPDQAETLLPWIIQDLLITLAASGAGSLVAMVADEQVLDRGHHPAVGVLAEAVPEFGLRLFDVLGVTSTAFSSLICGDPRCCPPGGQPIDQVLTSPSAVAHVVVGGTVAETEGDLIAQLAPPAPPVVTGPVDSPTRLDWWERWVQARADAIGAPGLDPGPGRVPVLSGFSAAMHDDALRDAVVMDLLGAPPEDVQDRLHDRIFSLNRPEPFGRGAELPPMDLRPPDGRRVEAVRAVLSEAVRAAGEGDRGPALAVLALLHWFDGQGARARLLAEQARADAPSVTLTRLVEDLIFRQALSPWRRIAPKG